MGRFGSPEHPGLASWAAQAWWGNQLIYEWRLSRLPAPTICRTLRTNSDTHRCVSWDPRRGGSKSIGFSAGSGSPFNGPDRAVVAFVLYKSGTTNTNVNYSTIKITIPLSSSHLLPSSSPLLPSPPPSPTQTTSNPRNKRQQSVVWQQSN